MWSAGSPAAVHMLVDRGADIPDDYGDLDVKYTIYAPTTVTLGKNGYPVEYRRGLHQQKGGQNALFFRGCRSIDGSRANPARTPVSTWTWPRRMARRLCSPLFITGIANAVFVPAKERRPQAAHKNSART